MHNPKWVKLPEKDSVNHRVALWLSAMSTSQAVFAWSGLNGFTLLLHFVPCSLVWKRVWALGSRTATSCARHNCRIISSPSREMAKKRILQYGEQQRDVREMSMMRKLITVTRSEAIIVVKVDKIFLGNQPCQFVKNSWHFRDLPITSWWREERWCLKHW